MTALANVESQLRMYDESDIEYGPTTKFEDYVQEVILAEKLGNAVYHKYGVTQLGQHFVLLHCHKWFHKVYLLTEPKRDANGNYIEPYPSAKCVHFYGKSKGSEYLKITHYNLQAENKFGCNMFSCFNKFDDYIQREGGIELFRVRDVDAKGKPFVFILKLRSPKFIVITLKISDSDPIYKKEEFSKVKHAGDYMHDIRGELQGHAVLYKPSESCTVNARIQYTDEFDYKEFETTFLNTKHRKVAEEAPEFIEFVKECLTAAFYGEECYRTYGITEALQHFAFVVIKSNYYKVRLVLEPDPRLKLDEAIMKYSCTFHVFKANNRFMIDNWVAQARHCLLSKKNGRLLSYWHYRKRTTKLYFSTVFDLENTLKRGDHIQRSLKIGFLDATHHDGIYLGNGQVAHFTTENNVGFFNSKGGSGPGIVDLNEFLKGEQAVAVKIYYPLQVQCGEDIAQNAMKLVQNDAWRKKYNLATRNCQLFAKLCVEQKFERLDSVEEHHRNWSDKRRCAKKCIYSCLCHLMTFLVTYFCFSAFVTYFFGWLFNDLLWGFIINNIIYFVIGSGVLVCLYKRSRARKEAEIARRVKTDCESEAETLFRI